MVRRSDFISLRDFTPSQILNLINKGLYFKKIKKYPQILRGKILALLFEKPSLRTRVSLEVAIKRLGAESIFLSSQEVGIGKREEVKDISRTLSLYVDGVIIRTFSMDVILKFREFSSIPVINALTDFNHPLQVLADLMTIKEITGRLKGINLSYIGDGNNVCHSLLYGASKVGLNLKIASPKKFLPQKEVFLEAEKFACTTGARIEFVDSPKEAVREADFIYTDVWTSMGKERESKIRRKFFEGFQINRDLLKYNKKKKFFIMHCLPAHRGEEITDEVLESCNSIVFLQAQNRLYAHMSVLYFIYKK